MASPIQRFFPRLGTTAMSFLRKPTGAIGTWTQTNLVFTASAARYVGPDSGSAQVQAVPVFAQVPNGVTQTLLLGQFLGDPLKEQTIPAGTWRVAFAAQLANAGVNYLWQGRAALHIVNVFTGLRRGTIFATTAIGSGLRTVTTERTCLADITGNAVKVRVGDYLCLELGIAVTNNAAALTPQASLFADGAITISSDNIAATDALTVLEGPIELSFSLPSVGEQPNPSVTHAQAVALIKEHWPPHTGVIYAWDESSASIKHYFDWLGDLIKLYGYDQVDRIFREISPLTCVELLPSWESLLGIALSRAAQLGRTIAQRRRTVLARLRERGPLTAFNLAAIFAQLANYAGNTKPDVIEISGDTDLRASNDWGEAVGTAIPVDVAFGATNLVRATPAFMDGGKAWQAGVRVTLGLNNTNTEGLRVQLMGPDFTVASWGAPDTYPLPSGLASTLELRATAHVGKPVQGAWRLHLYRLAGAPAVTLVSWRLYVLSEGHNGRAGAKFHWAVGLDSTHEAVDWRDVGATLDRITQTYAQGRVVYQGTNADRPGTNRHRPGRFIPGL